jgi:predicted regulator of amino acid metabolism with ACT domain
MNDPNKKPERQAIPDQLIQIAHEQEGGAERVISQIEVAQNSFEEIQNLVRQCNELVARHIAPSPELDELMSRLEEITTHADNGMYNIQGVYDLFQYQDIVRQKLEKVGHRLIDVSEYILSNLCPTEESTMHAPSGRDILARKAQSPDLVKDEADAVVAEFFAKLRAQKPPA